MNRSKQCPDFCGQPAFFFSVVRRHQTKPRFMQNLENYQAHNPTTSLLKRPTGLNVHVERVYTRVKLRERLNAHRPGDRGAIKKFESRVVSCCNGSTSPWQKQRGKGCDSSSRGNAHALQSEFLVACALHSSLWLRIMQDPVYTPRDAILCLALDQQADLNSSIQV